MNYLYDLFIKKAEILSHALEKANERCRLMLYVTTLGSVLLIVVTFNTYYSWNTKINARDRMMLSEETGSVSLWQMRKFDYDLGRQLGILDLETFHRNISKNVLNLSKKLDKDHFSENDYKIAEALSGYFENLNRSGLIIDKTTYFDAFLKRQSFTIPLLGLSCSESDLFFIGSIFIIILLVYTYFNVRREERILYRIVKSIKFIDQANLQISLGIRDKTDIYEILSIKYKALEILFQGCVNSFVFTTIANDSDDYWVGNERQNFLPSASDDYWQNTATTSKSNGLASFVKRYIDYFPIISLTFIGVSDLISFYRVFTYLNTNDIIEFWGKFILGLILYILCFRQCRIIHTVNSNTAHRLMDMRNVIKRYRADLKQLKKAKEKLIDDPNN